MHWYWYDTHLIHLPCRHLPAFSLKPLLITPPGPPLCFLIENKTEELCSGLWHITMCCFYCRHCCICVTFLWCCGSACISKFHEQMHPMLHKPALGMKWYEKQQRIRGSSNVNPPPSKTFCSAAFCYELLGINPFSLVNWERRAFTCWTWQSNASRQRPPVVCYRTVWNNWWKKDKLGQVGRPVSGAYLANQQFWCFQLAKRELPIKCSSGCFSVMSSVPFRRSWSTDPPPLKLSTLTGALRPL